MEVESHWNPADGAIEIIALAASGKGCCDLAALGSGMKF